MNFVFVRNIIMKMIGKLPKGMKSIVLKNIVELRYLALEMSSQNFRVNHNNSSYSTPSATKVYLVSPDRIKYGGNITQYFGTDKLRGKVLGGDWDLKKYKFEDEDIYKALEARLKQGISWKETDFYKRVLRQAKLGAPVRGIMNEAQLIDRCNYLDSLCDSIKTNGYLLNRTSYHKYLHFEEEWEKTEWSGNEIDVNIDRNGDYIFQGGQHRLCIAKLIGIQKVPVMVYVRHKQWQDFRKFVVSYARNIPSGKLYQPIVHPDLADIPYDIHHNYDQVMTTMQNNLGKNTGVMLDIGSNFGFFCHKFEDLGYQCYAVEINPASSYIMQTVRNSENKTFRIINKSILDDIDFVKTQKFDVVLALNIFHHFLKTKESYFKLQKLLENLRTDEIFFEPHKFNEDQMSTAYVNMNALEFVAFILEHTGLTKYKQIYIDKTGRKIFKLYK